MTVTAEIEEKVFTMIKEHHMLRPGDKAVVGVSGGADSVCLLFVLLEWAKRVPLKLAVAHVNHGLRKDAGEDEAYVRELCRRQGIPFFVQEADVRQEAGRRGISEEEAGRILRYQTFNQVSREFGAQKIAVAHNRNDLAETMLFHLFRGSGISGLCGIRPVRDQVIRPILCLERREVEAYLKARGVSYRTDSTNQEDAYTRNRIRHHILPYAQEQVQGGCIANMARTAEQLLETEDYLEERTREAYRFCTGAACGQQIPSLEVYVLGAAAFRSLHPAIKKRLIYNLLKKLSPSHKDISYRHILDVLTLFEQQSNRTICLPETLRARREYDKVILEREASGTECSPEPETGREVMLDQLTQKDRRLFVPGLGELVFTVFSREKKQDIPQNRYTKWFDYDKMKKSLILRHRQTKDYLSIPGGGAERLFHKTVKSYMIEEKIPSALRDQVWLLTQEHHVVWVIGGRISEYYKINENTKRILQVQLRRDCVCSGTEEDNGGARKSDVDGETGG